MTNKKFYWTVIPILILLIVSAAMNVIAWRYFKGMALVTGVSEVGNAKFRAEKIIKIQGRLNDGKIEETQNLIRALYLLETMTLDQMQNSDLYPEKVRRAAKAALAEIESSFDQSPKNNEQVVEGSN